MDDQAFNIEALKIILKVLKVDISAQVHSASNGLQAVEQVKNQLRSGTIYDVIFMDCNMPFMDGYQATQEIRAIYGDSPCQILAVTGHSEGHYVQRAYESGMDKLISKPASVEDIKDIIVLAEEEKNPNKRAAALDSSLKIQKDDSPPSKRNHQALIELIEGPMLQSQGDVGIGQEPIGEQLFDDDFQL